MWLCSAHLVLLFAYPRQCRSKSVSPSLEHVFQCWCYPCFASVCSCISSQMLYQRFDCICILFQTNIIPLPFFYNYFYYEWLCILNMDILSIITLHFANQIFQHNIFCSNQCLLTCTGIFSLFTLNFKSGLLLNVSV